MYDYQCEKCDLKFSELRRGSEMNDPISCPSCKATTSKRLVTGFSVGSISGGGPASSCASASSCPAAGFS
ncbi:MAG: zinc ribbon domain-containing protein [Proteobacteria bacterium]|nr:zinc ribbon domain-containing protein [Pseudomonadota bacterium]